MCPANRVQVIILFEEKQLILIFL